MTQSLRHKIFVILLGLFVTLGMGMTVVHSNLMAIDVATADSMTKTGNMGANSKSPCNDCLDGKNMTKGVNCVAGCVAVVHLVQPATDHFQSAWVEVEPLPSFGTPLSQNYPPDPYPPRFLDLA